MSFPDTDGEMKAIRCDVNWHPAELLVKLPAAVNQEKPIHDISAVHTLSHTATDLEKTGMNAEFVFQSTTPTLSRH